MAREAGLQGRATRMALLSDDGFEATYLASSLRRPPVEGEVTPVEGPAPSRPTADRLRELDRLRDEGLVTAEEHAERRRAILEGI